MEEPPLSTADQELAEAMAPRARWILPAGLVVAGTSLCLVGLLGAMFIAVGTVVLYLVGRNTKVSEQALGIGFAVMVVLCGGAGFFLAVTMQEAAYEAGLGQPDIDLDVVMEESMAEVAREAAEEMARDAGDH